MPSAASFLEAPQSAGSFLDTGFTKKDVMQIPLGMPETAAHLGSSLLAGVPAGLAGIAALPFGKGAETVQNVSEALTYQPRTRAGKAISEVADKPFEWYEKGADWVGNAVLAATGSPALATAAKTAIYGLPMAAGGRAGAKGRAAKVTEEAKAVPAAPDVERPFPVAAAEAAEKGKVAKPSQSAAAFLDEEAAFGKAAGELDSVLPLKEKPALSAEEAEAKVIVKAEREKVKEEKTKSADDFLKPETDAEALEKYGPGTLGANPMLDPALLKQTARDIETGARGLFTSAFGAPGEYRNMFDPIRDREQTNVARVERWASGEGYRIRQAFPTKEAREALTLAITRGDLSQLKGQQMAIAVRLKANYEQMGKYALDAEKMAGMRQDYSPQIWDMTDTKTAAMIEMWREASGKPPQPEGAIREGAGVISPFMLERAIKNVDEGIKLGLKPASLDAADLFETYAKSMSHAIERGKTLNALANLMTEDGQLMLSPTKSAPKDYVRINNPELEGMRVHPDIAPAVKVLVETRDPGVIGVGLQSLAYASKRALVSYSFFHPTALLSAWEGTFPGGKAFNPKGAIDAALKQYRDGGMGDVIDKGLAAGLKIGAPLEDVMGRERFGRIASKAEKFLDKAGAGAVVRVPREIDRMLQKGTWDYVHTGLKLETFSRKFESEITKNAERIAKGEITEGDIARQVAEFTNATYGGLNWERMIDKFDTPLGKKIMSEIVSHSGRRWMQTFMFAPDWMVSTVGSWTNAVTGGENAAIRQSLARRYLATSAVITFGIGNALNYYFTGHSMLDNKSTKKGATLADQIKAKTEVQLGDGRRMNINKHFMEVPHAAADPVNWALGKTNPMTVGEPIEQLFNKQWLSTGWVPPITEKKDKPLTAAGKRAGHAAKKFVPIPGQAIMQQGPAGLGGFFGFPVYGMTEKQKAEARAERAK